MPLVKLAEQILHGRADGGQRVADLVRDGGRQLAGRRQTLGAVELAQAVALLLVEVRILESHARQTREHLQQIQVFVAQINLSDEDLNLLQMLTSLASVAFENAYLYQQQRDRLRQLYRAERLAAAGELAASVAHEIRNPLTSIRSTVQYLLGEFDEGHAKRPLVEGVISEVDRINQTVDGLLSLTRRVEFKPERLSLGQLIEQSLLLIGTKARNQAVDIVWSQPIPDIYVSGDVSQIKQLLLNLVLNALQAMPEGGRLSIELIRKRAPDEMGREKTWAEVAIKDTGCGIPTDNIE